MDAAAVRLLPPAVPLVTILAGLGLGRLWPVDLGLGRAAPWLSWIGGAIMAAAVAIAIWAIVLLKRSEQDPSPWKPTPAILERGPFRWSRNPIYLQMVLFCLGFAIRRTDVWVLALTPLAAWLLHELVILPEEDYLEHKFGERYLAYKRRVRRWI